MDRGALLELTGPLFELLQLCRTASWKEVDEAMAADRPPWNPGSARRLLEPLLKADLFRFVPFDLAQQEVGIAALWQHRPRRVQLLLAQQCNLRCIYCYEESSGSNARHRLMSLEVAKKAVDFLVERSGPRIDLQVTFFGGEPLLNWKVFRDVVEYCRQIEKARGKRFIFELITNGSLLSEEVLSFLIANRFLLMISLDGFHEMHNFQRPTASGDDVYATVLANAKRANMRYKAARQGLSVKVRANLTHEYHDLERVVRFFEGEGFTTIGIACIEALPWEASAPHACTLEDLEEVGQQRHGLLEAGLRSVLHGERCSPFERKLVNELLEEIRVSSAPRGLKCGVGRNTAIVDTDGNIYPCHRYGNLEPYILGNVARMALDEENTLAYYRALSAAALGKCRACWARNLCSGPCPWEVSHPDGHILEPREEQCARIRAGFERTLLYRKRLLEQAPHLVPEKQDGCAGLCPC